MQRRYRGRHLESSRPVTPCRLCMAAVVLAVMLSASGPAFAADVVVRVVFQFKDDLLKKQYPNANLPIAEQEISRKMAMACKERLRHWTFEASNPAALAAVPPSARTPALTIWVSHKAKYELLMALQGPLAAAPLSAWRVTLYEPGDLAIHGLPDGDQLAVDIVDKFRYQPDSETLLQKFDGDINGTMQKSVPIALGDQYRYVGPDPLQSEADAVVVVMLDTSREEYKELRYSKFLIRCTFKQPRAGEVKVLATANGQDPPQPMKGVKLWLSSWAEGTADLTDLGTIRQSNASRFAQILSDVVSLKCELVYLWEFNRQDAMR